MGLYADLVEALADALAAPDVECPGSPAHERIALITSRTVASFRAKAHPPSPPADAAT